MSLSFEDYITKDQKMKMDVCFKESRQSRRFKVHTDRETYAFPWMHVLHSTLSLDEGEIILNLPQHIIEITGYKLKPIHEAITQDSLDFVRVLPREMLSVEAIEGTVVQSIEIQERSAPPRLPIKKSKSESKEESYEN
jgi:hypothetical protein